MAKSRDYWETALLKALNNKAALEQQDETTKQWRPRSADITHQKKMGKVLRRIEYIKARIKAFQPTAWKRLLEEE